MKKSHKMLSIRVTEELYNELERLAIEEGDLTRSSLIRRMIKESIRARKEKKEKKTVDTCQNK